MHLTRNKNQIVVVAICPRQKVNAMFQLLCSVTEVSQ